MSRRIDMRVMRIPRAIRTTKVAGGYWSRWPTYCSLCEARIRLALILTSGETETWWAVCLRCVKQMAEAVEDA